MAALIRQIPDSVKRFSRRYNVDGAAADNAVIAKKNSQRFGFSRGNAGFQTAEAKNNSEQLRRITARNSQQQ
jgi:hypothetical protein